MFPRKTAASIVTAVALAVGGLASTTSHAQTQPVGEPGTSEARYGYERPYAYNPPYPRDFPQALVERIPDGFAKEARSRALLWRANSAMTYTFTKLRFFQNRSNDFRTVAANEKDAFSAYQSARDAALAKLATNEDYKAVVALRDELSDRLEQMRQIKDIQPQMLIPLAEEKMNYSRTASAMEAKALAEDAAVAAARDKFVAAGTQLAQTKVEMEDQLRYHPDVEAARTRINDAKVDLIAAAAYNKGLIRVSNRALDYAYYINSDRRSVVYPTADYYYPTSDYGYYGYRYGR